MDFVYEKSTVSDNNFTLHKIVVKPRVYKTVGNMHQLPAHTVRLLSSSQVVTSVVNVVKELTENALDAEASSVDVKLDLETLQTYGFRGEALGSICAVAEVAVWQKSKMSDLRSALVATLGPSSVSNLQQVQHQHHEPQILLEGFFPKPGADLASTSSSSPDKSFIFINDRPVQHKEISKLIREKYTAQFSEDSRSRFPTFVLRVNVSAAALDVNVTPDKTQVLLHHKEAVLAAVEELLESLYGSNNITKNSSTEEQTDPKTSNTSNSTKDLEENLTMKSKQPCPPENTTIINKNTHISNKEIPQNRSSDASLHCQNSSSSSSVAEDWIVNQLPSFSLFDEEELLQTCAKEPNLIENSPDKLEEDGLETRKDSFTSEEWSRGTALRDSESDQPLQPVTILQPNSENGCKKAGVSNKEQTSNSIIEKRAALKAYDVLDNRTINEAVRERWKALSQEEKKRFEDKAQKHTDQHEQAKSASTEASRRVSAQGHKRKAAPLSNQQLLDQLFSAQPQKKLKQVQSKPCRSVRFSLGSVRQNLLRLSQSKPSTALGLEPVCRMCPQGSWLVLSGQRLMVLNPFRVEEALLFKRLVENNRLPTVDLKEPIELTEEMVGGAEFMEVLCEMERDSPELDGSVLFSDLRLVANGFKIKLYPAVCLCWPCSSRGQVRQVRVVALSECVPFLGVSDLREILGAVVQKKSRAVSDCRPLKVCNYLKGEAVRLVRQMPSASPELS
ncbi:hypothetical protein WMY93_001646 [Mugilogobius chulae]|uniref:DNA mismatch repair protein S5 domain-containing protein n=1 Tax=Mugilogobius chulae TaxID=88201 RepID=A0AAW0PRX3_9GOBI